MRGNTDTKNDRSNDRSRFLEWAGAKLWVTDVGPIDAQHTIICLHGMRDHSESFRALEEEFSTSRVILPDLRGHGRSDWTPSYTLTEFVADLSMIVTQLEINAFDLIGHSLGGHIVTRYAAAFADRVRRLVVIDGFGPPRSPEANSPAHLALSARREIEQRMLKVPASRVMNNVAEASARLARNNPKLSQQEAERLALYGVKDVPGGVVWRWDGQAQSIWSSFSHRDTELLLQAIECPTLVITGDDGLSYWLGMHPELEGAHALYQSELKRRCDLIPNSQHWVVEGAGHMVHYDQPHRLYQGLKQFLQAS